SISSFVDTERSSIDESSIATTPQAEVIAPVTSESGPLEAAAQKPATVDFGEANPAPVSGFDSPAPASTTSADAISASPPSANAADQQAADASVDAEQELPAVAVTETLEAIASSSSVPLVRAVEPEAEQPQDPKLDTETVKGAAAAWASWRQIRDTNKGPEVAPAEPREIQSTDFGASQSASEEIAAAVAAGAEHSLPASTAGEPSRNSSDV